jgi:hypothetical protein
MAETPTKQYTIIQFEPDPFYQINLDLILTGIGQKVNASAGSAKEANNLLASVKAGSIKPDIAIISNYFTNNWDDGAMIAKRLRETSPNTKIIGYSVMRGEKPEWADAYAVKSGLDNQQTILKSLASLLNISVAEVKEEDNY